MRPKRSDSLTARSSRCFTPNSGSFRTVCLVRALQKTRPSEHAATDLLRAAQLPLLPRDETHVDEDLKRIDKGKPLPHVLLIRGDVGRVVSLLSPTDTIGLCAVIHLRRDRPCLLPLRHARPLTSPDSLIFRSRRSGGSPRPRSLSSLTSTSRSKRAKAPSPRSAAAAGRAPRARLT
jgi:hypothetical protein